MNKRLREAVLAALEALPEGDAKKNLHRELRRTKWGFVAEELTEQFLPAVAYKKIHLITIAKYLGIPIAKLHALDRSGKLQYELYDGGFVYNVDDLFAYIQKTKEL